VHYPTELFNSVNPPGMLSHNITLKVGAPIVLLHDLNPPSKLCNGADLQIMTLHNYLLKAIIISDRATGKKVVIHQIPLIFTDTTFQFKRLQIPVRLCFAMIINKAQGQTLWISGVNVTYLCFFH